MGLGGPSLKFLEGLDFVIHLWAPHDILSYKIVELNQRYIETSQVTLSVLCNSGLLWQRALCNAFSRHRQLCQEFSSGPQGRVTGSDALVCTIFRPNHSATVFCFTVMYFRVGFLPENILVRLTLKLISIPWANITCWCKGRELA